MQPDVVYGGVFAAARRSVWMVGLDFAPIYGHVGGVGCAQEQAEDYAGVDVGRKKAEMARAAW